ncbi:MAG: alpha/beta hydrolase [Clostridia bacterium]|nr:alpha/beta hydrolase [Clostridia bacterium]
MILLTVLICLVCCFCAAVLIVHGAIFTNRASPLFSYFAKRGRDPGFQAHREEAERQMSRAARTEMTAVSSRGERLLGYYYPCGETPSGRIALMVHGLGSNHTQACGMHYEYYHRHGFDVFCCENQGMKRKRGRYVGYGVWEEGDCLDWIAHLTARFGENTVFVLHGFSMGASSLLRICDRCPPQVRFLVSDSGFSNGDRLLASRLRGLYLPVRLWNRFRLGYDIRDTDTVGRVRESRVPILFVHGLCDRVVPYAMGEELYAACGGEKELLTVAGAGHVESRHRDAAAYDAGLDAFMARYVAELPRD